MTTASRSAQKTVVDAAEAERPARGARRKQETRRRLLDAALRLMSERGMAGVAVNEVTEAADVGFGSFYNHFPSKEAIYAALIDDVFDDFGNALDRIADHVTDPAEVLAASVRYTITRAIAEPVWGRFLVQTGLSPRGLSGGLGRRMARDIGIGVASGRFKAEDQLLVSIAVGSTVLGAITLALELPNKKSRNTVAERTADVLLRILGLTPKQASTIARRPLPKLNGSKV